MPHPERLTATCLLQVHAPPALTTLRQLSMVHCALGAADDSPQEAVWLQIGYVGKSGALW